MKGVISCLIYLKGLATLDHLWPTPHKELAFPVICTNIKNRRLNTQVISVQVVGPITIQPQVLSAKQAQ